MAVASPEARIQDGYVLEFVTSGGAPRLGVAVRPDGKKNWIVEDRNGHTLSVPPKAVSFVLGDLGSPPGAPARDVLAGVAAECDALVRENAELLEVAWEIVGSRGEDEGGTSVDVVGVAELVFDDASVRMQYAAHVMLAGDRFFFKRRVVKGAAVYEAKPAGLVAEVRSLILAEDRRKRDEEELRAAILASFNGGAGGGTGALRSLVGEDRYLVMVSALEAIAEDFGGRVRDAMYETSPESGFSSLTAEEKAAAKLVLDALGKAVVPPCAFDVLVAWGVFVRHENLALRRAGLHESMPFSDGMLRAASALSAADAASVVDLDAARRRDLTGLVSYAVDSADTEEVDDAISWDAAEKIVWVHVADPSRFFPGGADDPLVREALRRTTTLYLPTHRYTMFPQDLARDRLSLSGAGADGSALSFGFRLLEDGSLDADATVITPSRIRPPRRQTYEQVDEILEREPADSMEDVCLLTRLAELRCAFRVQDGAVESSSPFSKVTVTDAHAEEPSVSVGITETGGRSWTLVSELMIAACGIAGDYGAAHAIPLPYRGQEPFEYPSEEALAEIPEGPARNAAIFKNAGSSETRAEPTVHASLALNAYVQVTSPIRRSVDLLAHMQIKAVLRGDSPAMDLDAMSSEIGRNGDAGRTMRTVDQATAKYWHLEYLRRLGPGHSHEAVYVRPLRDGDGGLGLVYLTESAFQLVAQVPSGTTPGSKVAVLVKQADPRGLVSRADATLWAAHEEKARGERDLIDDLFSAIDSDDEVGAAE